MIEHLYDIASRIVSGQFCCALGTSVLLTGRGWPQRPLSASGRCRAFDASASGLVPGEATAAVLLRRDACEQAQLEGVQVRHTGRTASLTAAGAEELLAEVLRMAGVRGGSVDVVDCAAGGRLLEDAAEAQAVRKARVSSVQLLSLYMHFIDVYLSNYRLWITRDRCFYFCFFCI